MTIKEILEQLEATMWDIFFLTIFCVLVIQIAVPIISKAYRDHRNFKRQVLNDTLEIYKKVDGIDKKSI